MRARRKLLVDRVLGAPIVVVLNVLARLLGALSARDHSVDRAATRVVAVAKFQGMGSILQATPLLAALRRAFPEAQLVFVSARANLPLLERIPGIDRIVTVDDASFGALLTSTLAAVRELAGLRIDHWFDLEVYAHFGALMSVFSLARNRIGFYRTSTRFKLGIYTHLVYFNTRIGVRELYLQLLRALGASDAQDGIPGPLTARDADRDAARAKLGLAPGESYVVLNPNASDLMLERRWPGERFAALAAKLAAPARNVILVGSASEAPYVRAIRAAVPPPAQSLVLDSAGRLSLGELIALLDGAALVVSNDSGPMHMAIALRRPTLGLFGPCSPAHYGIDAEWVVTVYEPVFCSPCLHETDSPPCAGNNVCMQRIGLDAVAAAAQALLAKQPRTDDTAWRPAARVLQDDAHQALGVVVRASLVHPMARACEACGGRQFRGLFERDGAHYQRCHACGTERIEPQPDDWTLGAIYGDAYYDAWGLSGAEDLVAAMKKATFTGHLARVGRFPAGAKVLDCGAATGIFMELLREQGYEPYGVEVSERGTAGIAARFGAARVFRGEVWDATFPDVTSEGGFDAITMFDFLEHVRDPARALAAAAVRLKPGGRLVLTTPRAGSLSQRLLGRYWPHYKTEHLYYFSDAGLQRLLAADFRETRILTVRKALTARYIRHYFASYPPGPLAPFVKLLGALPLERTGVTLHVPTGEMLVTARRAG